MFQVEQPSQYKQVIHCGEAFARFPFVDRLRVLKPEVLLHLADRKSAGDAKLTDPAAGLHKIDNREKITTHHIPFLLRDPSSNYFHPESKVIIAGVSDPE